MRLVFGPLIVVCGLTVGFRCGRLLGTAASRPLVCLHMCMERPLLAPNQQSLYLGDFLKLSIPLMEASSLNSCKQLF